MDRFSIKLINNLTKKEVNIDNLEDSERSNMFYHFNIELVEDLEDGEYTYELIKEEKIIATGLLQVGDYKRDTNINTEYKNNRSDIIVYGN
jgi:hypothetical protein